MTFVQAENALREQSIPERFEEVVARYPDRLAVKFEQRSLSYRDLNQISNRIARSLRATIADSESTSVALLFDHGLNVVAAMIGASKAGIQFCALDSRAPEERMKFIVEDSRSSTIVTDTNSLALAKRIAGYALRVLNVDEIDPTISSDDLQLLIPPHQNATFVYTSGSTGQPKRVARTHHDTVSRAISTADLRELSPNERLSLLHAVGFGAGGADLFSALLNGVAIVPFDIASEGIRPLVSWLRRERITIFHSPPTVFRELENIDFAPDDFPDLRLIRLTGAPVTKRDFELYKNKFAPGTLLEVGMGSTEVGPVCNALVNHDFVFPEEGSPIGYARKGKEIVILDDDGGEKKTGETGEIAVRSRDFTPEFCRQRDLPEEKFRRDPKDADALIYLTGDVGMKLSDGFVVQLGRKDLMAKIRGFRADMSEIEQALLQHPMVKEAGVAAWSRDAGDTCLAGYIVPRHGAVPNASTLNDFIRHKLPDYMIPSTYVILSSLPMTNGKLDRHRLPKPDNKRPALHTPYTSPRSSVEETLARIWAEVLGVHPIGIHDNFFDLGGHSLAATRIVSQVIKKFQLEIPLQSLFQSPTVAKMAATITVSQGKKLGDKEMESLLIELEGLTEKEAQKLLSDQRETGRDRK